MKKDSSYEIYVEKKLRIPSFTMNNEHTHTYCEIYYLKTGTCTYTSRGRIYPLAAGDLLIMPPGEPHGTKYSGEISCERYVLCFRPDRLPSSFTRDYAPLLCSFSRPCKVFLPAKIRPELEHLLLRILEENRHPLNYSQELQLLTLLSFLYLLHRSGIFVYEPRREIDRSQEDIEAAIQYIIANFASPLRLEEVAGTAGLTPNYLSRKFKKATGVTFKEYVNYIRIRQACRMLLITDDSITSIALNCGFNSSNYFKDCFRKINGMSPRTFRQRSGALSPAYSDRKQKLDSKSP